MGRKRQFTDEERRERARASQRRWRERNPEKIRDKNATRRRNRNREKEAARKRLYREQNREEINARAKLYRKNNKKKQSEYERRRFWDDPANRREACFRSKYGITFADRDRMIEQQNMRCVGCESSFSEYKPCVDHCHKTGRIRGVLCAHCNSALGYARDNPATMQRLIAYLAVNSSNLSL